MSENRIYFKGNPWPEGHPIKSFVWKAKEIDGEIWFDFDLESDNYYCERDIEDDEEIEYMSDWVAPIVWGNFHRCSISSDESNGFRVCDKSDYTKEFLDGLTVKVDSNMDFREHEWEDFTFHTYLLGHDAVTDHTIEFKRITGSELFDIFWKGKIALAYVGDYEFKHEFRAEIRGAELPSIK